MSLELLFQDLQYVKGIGPQRAEVLKQIGIKSVLDLLEFFPRRYLDRSNIKKIIDVKIDEEVTLIGEVVAVHIQPGRKQRLVVTIRDDTGYLQGIWFHGIQFFRKMFEKKQLVSFSGKISYYGGWQIMHPDYDILGEEIDSGKFINTGMIIPVYPSNELLKKKGLTSYKFRQIFKIFFERHHALPDILPYRSGIELPMTYYSALKEIHFPSNESSLMRAYYVLKYTELFMVQLLVALRRYLFRVSHSAKPFLQPAEKTKKFIRSLPFEFTEAQRRVLRDIWNDLKSDIPMRRLLQGDVGSGKTVVAFTAMLYSVENGFQAVLMAPTEILAEQHYLLAKKYFERLGINLTILKGSQKQSARKEAYEDIRKGNTGIIIGTHALIQKEVEFNNLGLVVIDEQHRFGVMQRQELITKGVHPHVLVMTATPIPRTLTMTLYGDLDVSVIDEIPAGRKRIKTVVRREEALDDIYNFLAGEISSGRQAYIVYPLIEESEKIDLEAAVKGYELIKKRFKNQTVGMVHGRMKVGEKEEVMNRFAAGDIKVLVATTVIEVGIDVPNASVMLIQNAERFGLSQLHQLRGRVGRGEYQSYCILIRSGKITEEGEMRLKAMSETIDGFKIAEIDLQIRGTGEFFGTRQSGFDDLKIANLIKDKKILTYARTEAFNLIQEDPELKKPENNHLKKVFLYKYRDKLQEMKLH